MNLPIKFPKDEDVIAEEVRRFRAQPWEARLRELDDMFNTRRFLLANTTRPEFAAAYDRDEEERGRAAVREFVARHA